MTPNPHVPTNGSLGRPAGWVRFVVKGAVFLAIAFVFSESLWRSLRYLPAKSDMIHFARLRKAADGDRSAVALVGSSRVRYGLNPQWLERAVPGRHFLQLGILGNAATPVLQDLAEDSRFEGVVICELNPAHWFVPNPSASLPETLAYTHPRVSGAHLETLLGEQFRERTSFFSYNLFTEVPRILQHKPIPAPERPDRFIPFADFGPKIDEVVLQGWLRGAQESAERINRVDASRATRGVLGLVERIRRRGGDVAFVRMPVDGLLRVQEDRLFPQTQTLIRDVRASGAVVIDFAEMPDHFWCPEGSHLEHSEANRFSRLLGEALAARGFFRQAVYGAR